MLLNRAKQETDVTHTHEDGVALSYEMQRARPHVTEQVSVAVTCIQKESAPSIGRNTEKLGVSVVFLSPSNTYIDNDDDDGHDDL